MRQTIQLSGRATPQAIEEEESKELRTPYVGVRGDSSEVGKHSVVGADVSPAASTINIQAPPNGASGGAEGDELLSASEAQKRVTMARLDDQLEEGD